MGEIMTVYARKEGTIIWSDNNKDHKAGRVEIGTPLEVLSESGGCYFIKRPAGLTLPPDPSYPDYWVATGDCVDFITEPVVPDPVLPGDAVTDQDAAFAMVTVLKWFKQ